jgi:transposase
MDKRQALRGIFWILDNGAKWKDLPRRFGSKSSVHKYFTLWTRAGVFEDLMRDAGALVEERGGYRLTSASSTRPSAGPGAAATAWA